MIIDLKIANHDFQVFKRPANHPSLESYQWLWEFTGYFMTKVEDNLCQLLCFPETIANIDSYILTVGSTQNTNISGERIFRLGSLQNVEDGSIISIGSVTLFMNELFPRRSQLGNEGFVIATSINSRTLRPVSQPVRIYSAEGLILLISSLSCHKYLNNKLREKCLMTVKR